MNLFAKADAENGEITEILHQTDSVRIERIVSSGQVSPDGFWYEQEEDEWVSVLQGEARLQLEQGEVLLQKGDHLLLAAHCRHRIVYTGTSPPCIWLCVFTKR